MLHPTDPFIAAAATHKQIPGLVLQFLPQLATTRSWGEILWTRGSQHVEDTGYGIHVYNRRYCVRYRLCVGLLRRTRGHGYSVAAP